MIRDVESFINYFDSIRRRTVQYVRSLPADRLDWTPRAGEFTCAELVRHLAAAESMFVGVAVTGRWYYPGHESGPGDTLETLTGQLGAGHDAAMKTLGTLSDAGLYEPRSILKGPPIKAWRVLMAMVEHEVHHRSQLAVYMALMGVEPPQIYGLGVEEVIALATG